MASDIEGKAMNWSPATLFGNWCLQFKKYAQRLDTSGTKLRLRSEQLLVYSAKFIDITRLGVRQCRWDHIIESALDF